MHLVEPQTDRAAERLTLYVIEVLGLCALVCVSNAPCAFSFGGRIPFCKRIAIDGCGLGFEYSI